MNIFGSNPGLVGIEDAFLERIGRYFRRPTDVLREAAGAPDLREAAAVLLLALMSRAQAVLLLAGTDLPPQAPPAAALGEIAGGFVLWLAAGAVWHGISRVLKKTGEFRTMLCLTAWSSAVYLASLPLALIESAFPALNLLCLGTKLIMGVGFVILLWNSLRIAYGWSEKGAALLLMVPLFSFFGLAVLMGLLVGAVAIFIGGVLLLGLIV